MQDYPNVRWIFQTRRHTELQCCHTRSTVMFIRGLKLTLDKRKVGTWGMFVWIIVDTCSPIRQNGSQCTQKSYSKMQCDVKTPDIFNTMYIHYC